MWLKLKNPNSQIRQDAILGILYNPPLHSRFFNNYEFEIFETELVNFCSRYDLIYVICDFNAQTAKLVDYSEHDHFRNEHFDLAVERTSYLTRNHK